MPWGGTRVILVYCNVASRVALSRDHERTLFPALRPQVWVERVSYAYGCTESCIKINISIGILYYLVLRPHAQAKIIYGVHFTVWSLRPATTSVP